MATTPSQTPVGDKNVLILYTGGTIGMKETERGFSPAPGFIGEQLAHLHQFHDSNKPLYTTPPLQYGRRTHFEILEYEPLLDSSNMGPTEWVRIARDIEENYAKFDAFIILHGTDTMAYTASALSFMLENLGKTVVITGSQIPLSQVRNDAVDNLLGALTVAGHYEIPEVCLYFRNKCMRGNRSSKTDASGFDAFCSGNCEPLVSVGIDIAVNWNLVRQPDINEDPTKRVFRTWQTLNSNVATLRIFPGIPTSIIENFLKPPMQGLVLETYGTGNAPDQRKDFLAVLKAAADRGVVIVNVTQCQRGRVSDHYAAGVTLKEHGVIGGEDMTPEAALTKLMYLLGKGHSTARVKVLIKKDLRGELTEPVTKIQFSFRDRRFAAAVARALNEQFCDNHEVVLSVKQALDPVLLCSAAGCGNLKQLQQYLAEGADVNICDYDRRTPLHLAAADGHLEVVHFLVEKGANVNALDRWGNSPIYDAIRGEFDKVAEYLRSKRGEYHSANVVADLCNAVYSGNSKVLQRMIENGADINCRDYDDRTPLHIAVDEGRQDLINYLLLKGANPTLKDRWGRIPSTVISLNSLAIDL